MLTWIHAIVDGEAATDHVGARGGCVLGQGFRGVGDLGAVFAVVDADDAAVAVAEWVGAVGWAGPVATSAEACGWWAEVSYWDIPE